MSMDTYFCYCCLCSDSDLISLFDVAVINGKEECYADMLVSSFNIKISKTDSEDFDTYICKVCAVRLKNTVGLRNMLIQTLNILEVNKVVKTTKCDNYLLVTKVQAETSIQEFSEEYNSINNDSNLEIILVEEYLEELEEVEYLDATTGEICSVQLNSTNLAENINKESLNKGLDVQPKIKRIRKKPKTPRIQPVEEIPYEITKNLECPVCTNEKFATEKMYHIHMNTHFPIHECQICARGFATKTRLSRHVKIHDVGVFPCPKCDQVFKSIGSMRSHNKRTHYVLKVNKCTICPERFHTYHARMVHLAKVHGFTEKTHCCKYCPKTFFESGGLYSHIKNVHEKKRYSCPVCRAEYVNRKRLEAHISSHVVKKRSKKLQN